MFFTPNVSTHLRPKFVTLQILHDAVRNSIFRIIEILQIPPRPWGQVCSTLQFAEEGRDFIVMMVVPDNLVF